MFNEIYSSEYRDGSMVYYGINGFTTSKEYEGSAEEFLEELSSGEWEYEIINHKMHDLVEGLTIREKMWLKRRLESIL